MNIQHDNILQQSFHETRKAKVLEIMQEGLILVQDSLDMHAVYPCYFLRTSAGILPELATNDLVLYRVPEHNDDYGVVLGVIVKYQS